MGCCKGSHRLHRLAESISGLLKSFQIPSQIRRGKIDSWNRIGTRYGIKSAMSHQILIFKAGIDFVRGSFLPHPENQFHDGTDSHKESILWNRCLGSLKVSKFGLVVRSQTTLPNFFFRNGCPRL